MTWSDALSLFVLRTSLLDTLFTSEYAFFLETKGMVWINLICEKIYDSFVQVLDSCLRDGAVDIFRTTASSSCLYFDPLEHTWPRVTDAHWRQHSIDKNFGVALSPSARYAAVPWWMNGNEMNEIKHFPAGGCPRDNTTAEGEGAVPPARNLWFVPPRFNSIPCPVGEQWRLLNIESEQTEFEKEEIMGKTINNCYLSPLDGGMLAQHVSVKVYCY